MHKLPDPADGHTALDRDNVRSFVRWCERVLITIAGPRCLHINVRFAIQVNILTDEKKWMYGMNTDISVSELYHTGSV